jgi:hypothetical protein
MGKRRDKEWMFALARAMHKNSEAGRPMGDQGPLLPAKGVDAGLPEKESAPVRLGAVKKSEFRRIAHWFFGQELVYVMLPLIASIVVAVAGYAQFALAYWLILGSGVWLEGHWLFSGFLAEKRVAGRRVFLKWLLSTSLLIAVFALGGAGWVHSTQMKYEQDDVLNHLSITPRLRIGKDALLTTFTITNGSSYVISARHRISCWMNLVQASNFSGFKGVGEVQRQDGLFEVFGDQDFLNNATIPAFTEIGAGDDAQTDACLSMVTWQAGGETICADVIVRFDYYLASQPKNPQHKSVRLIYGGSGGNSEWVGQPLQSTVQYCRSPMLPQR